MEKELLEILGINPEGTVAVFSVDPDYADTPDSTALYVVLVEGERVIVVSHGWGASGAHVDVRCFVGAEPVPVEPVVIEAGGTVMILNSVTDTRPERI